MAQVSKKILQPRISERIFDIFLKSISELNSKKEVVDFFDDLLTPTEKIMLSKRLSIAFLLAKNYDYRSIMSMLNVSNGTVWTVSSAYNSGEGYKKLVKKVQSDEKVARILLEIGEGISRVGSLGTKGSGTWKAIGKKIKEKKYEKLF